MKITPFPQRINVPFFTRSIQLLLLLVISVTGTSFAQTTYKANLFEVNSGASNGIKFWNNSDYMIKMGNTSGYHYGPVTAYSIKSTVYSAAGRGWTWGLKGETPIAALSNNGIFQVKMNLVAMNRIGINNIVPRQPFHMFGESPTLRLEEQFYSNHLTYDLGVEDGNFYIRRGQNVEPNYDHNYSTMTELLSLSSTDFNLKTTNFRFPSAELSITPSEVVYYNNFKVKSNGFVYARQMEIMGSGTFPDYVFDSDYELRTLEEVEDYIKENHHLPDVPSAQEVQENGHNLGEMDEILLKKIEELTLYVIELKKENERLSKAVDELQNN